MPGGINGPPVLNGSPYIYPSKTLGALTAEVLIRLGFISRIPNAPTRSLVLMRTDVLAMLGFLDPLAPVPTRSLGDMREDLLTSLAAPPPIELDVSGNPNASRSMALMKQDVANAIGMPLPTHPPGLDLMIEHYIELAHQRVWRRLEMDSGSLTVTTPPAWDITTGTAVDYVPVLILAIGLTKAHYGYADAKYYFDQLEQYMADRLKSAPITQAQADLALQEAQETIYRRYELGIETYALAPFVDDADMTTIDYRPVLALATADMKALLKQPDAQRYYDEVERYVADLFRRHPPNIIEITNTALAEAQQTIYRRYELGIIDFALAPLTVDADLSTIDYRPIVTLATADLKALFKQPDAKRYYDELERYMADLQRRKPPEAEGIVMNALRDAQEQMYLRYTSLRGDQWWKWILVPGERFYDVVKDGSITLDFRKVKSVWIEDGGIWTEIYEGINPRDFSHEAPGLPIRYELREFIELWPAPSHEMNLHLFGHLGLKPFVLETDTTTIDFHLVFLKALAMCKGHYRQPDAGGVDRDTTVHLGQLVAAAHGNRRYIPNENLAGHAITGVDYGFNVRREEGGGVRRMETT